MMNLPDDKKTILITGGTHGIGLSAAKLFWQAGWRVAVCASNPEDERGPKMEREYPGLRFFLADIRNENAMHDLIDEIIHTCGRLDAAFNNAGTGCSPRPIHLADLSESRRIVEVNLIGTMICMKHEIDVMLRQKEGGVIVNNASIAAVKALTGADSSYSAAKAGILALTREAAACAEYREKIRFYTVVPGYIETRMTACDDKKEWVRHLPAGRPAEAADVADLVLELVSNRVLPTGQTLFADGGAFLI